VFVAGFPAELLGTNCYVIAPAVGEECVIVDPGVNVIKQLDAVLTEHRLRPVAVLLTHGHLDHTFSVAPVCGARGITAYIHPDDAELLADPGKALSADLSHMLFGGRLSYSEPEDVAPLTDGAVIELAGLSVTVDHTPGHTPGSVMFRLPGSDGDGDGTRRVPPLCFSGDVLFAGSIGRTDLPGGDPEAMWRSLRTKVLPLDDEVAILPGHGPATTMGWERLTNPYLKRLTQEGAGGHRPAGGATTGGARGL